MNRTGLVIALIVGAIVGVVFAVYPQLDVAISRLFFNEAHRVFPVQYKLIARHLRDVLSYIVAALVAPADSGHLRPPRLRRRRGGRSRTVLRSCSAPRRAA